MAIVNGEHLFTQAERLIASPRAGPPRQADLRRAVSAAYYGVFHVVLTALADEFVGAMHRRTSRYALVYRGIEHRALRALCKEARKPRPAQLYDPFFPPGGFDADIRAFAGIVVELQERRHAADYDPLIRIEVSDARLAIEAARGAVRRFRRADAAQRKTFLTLLLCPPR